MTDFDIDQCNKEGVEEDDASAEPSENGGPRQRNQISYFSETHKCHRETSQVRQCNKVFGNIENIAKRVTGKNGLEQIEKDKIALKAYKFLFFKVEIKN